MQLFVRRLGRSLIGMMAIGAITGTASAAQLHVRPVMIELAAPSVAATLTLTNRGRSPITSQIRIFRWTQEKGRDVLKRTRKVVASPPHVRMRPGKEYIVRVVRLSKKPLVGEEAYRLIVDQIPEKKLRTSGVVFALRYSIPVFFHAPDATPASVSWRAVMAGKRLVLKASNSGQRFERISNLRVTLPNGKTHVISKGLAGYVLGKSARVWRVNARVRKGARITIRGQGKDGPFKITTRVR